MTIINSGLLLFWTVFVLFTPDLVYRTQKRWFPASRETWGVVMYSFLGAFKIVVIVFCLVPWLALLIIG